MMLDELFDLNGERQLKTVRRLDKRKGKTFAVRWQTKAKSKLRNQNSQFLVKQQACLPLEVPVIEPCSHKYKH